MPGLWRPSQAEPMTSPHKNGTQVSHFAENIARARAWAKKTHGVKRPQDTVRTRKYVRCPKCDGKPCCCG